MEHGERCLDGRNCACNPRAPSKSAILRVFFTIQNQLCFTIQQRDLGYNNNLFSFCNVCRPTVHFESFRYAVRLFDSCYHLLIKLINFKIKHDHLWFCIYVYLVARIEVRRIRQRGWNSWSVLTDVSNVCHTVWLIRQPIWLINRRLVALGS